MKLPARVKVGPCDYEIKEWVSREAAWDGHYGVATHRLRIIEIDCSYGPHQTAWTLLHELLHCIWSVWELEKQDSQERIVSVLSGGLAEIWRDNPDLMRWIARRLEKP